MADGTIDNISVTEDGIILVRRVITIDDVSSFHRSSYEPGADLSAEDDEVRAAAAQAWTDDVVSRWLASRAPAGPAVPQTISDRQFFQALALAGKITTQEALAAVKVGDIPAALQSLIATLPQDQQFAAEMLLSGATIFDRRHPMTAMLGAGMGWTDQEVDALWISAAAL